MAIPTKDSLLVPFSTNFNDRIVASPTTFALTALQAAAYTALHDPYIAAYNALTTALADGTRSKSLTQTKDTAKGALLEFARQLYTFVQSNASVSDANKTLLGIHVRDGGNTPVPAPTQSPMMTIASSVARTVTVSLYDPTTRSRRAKPAGAVCAYVYSFVGTTYPSDPTLWEFKGASTKGKYEVAFADSVASGAQVWLCAAWVNGKGESGPPSTPVSTNIQGGGSSEEGAMKIAA